MILQVQGLGLLSLIVELFGQPKIWRSDAVADGTATDFDFVLIFDIFGDEVIISISQH